MKYTTMKNSAYFITLTFYQINAIIKVHAIVETNRAG